MPLQLPPTQRVANVLLCTALLSACSSKLTEPVKSTALQNAAPNAMLNTQATYSPSNYGVPEVGRVDFSKDAHAPMQDLTY